uniref:Uncharacterized protein n=1 Tax=Anguilla anguilla TaxID=7936 RepID=A0A0E9T2D6_ANGAN
MVALRNSIFNIVVLNRLLIKLEHRVHLFNSYFGCRSTERPKLSNPPACQPLGA